MTSIGSYFMFFHGKAKSRLNQEESCCLSALFRNTVSTMFGEDEHGVFSLHEHDHARFQRICPYRAASDHVI